MVACSPGWPRGRGCRSCSTSDRRLLAGQTTYDLSIHVADPAFVVSDHAAMTGRTTIGVLTFTPSQKLMMLALAEPVCPGRHWYERDTT